MSKQVDERVVSMQFDNKNFEKNVSTSMSTLDKLKHSLNFKDSEKSLQNLSKSTEEVRAKFSALDVVAITALSNITNSAINAGKKLISSLTIDQVTAGWSKYEQKTASVQTILNATGKSIDEVNAYLEKLMWYSDETSYGFNDMVNALATMTSSGGDIDKLIPMIEGVANATAFAGKGAAEFSRVMQYAVNQAYSLGYMQVQDWKSIEGATVNSKQLIQTLIAAGEELGKIQKGTVTIENFRATLKDKWLDNNVMEKGFGKFAELTEAAYKAVDSGQFETAADAIAALADQYDEVAVKAFSSAQEAKSFTEAIEATKDAVSSGWMKTAEIIFGDYQEAKKTWTKITNTLWDIFAKGAESRNNLLEKALNSKWKQLTKVINNAGISVDDFKESLINVAKDSGVLTDQMIENAGSFEESLKSGWLTTDVFNKSLEELGGTVKLNASTLEELQKVVKSVIRGEFDNGAKRVKELTEAGLDSVEVQRLVNLIWERNGNTWKNTTITIDDLKSGIKELSTETLKNAGYTEDQVKQIKEFGEGLIDGMDQLSGREHLMNSLTNSLESISLVLGAIGDAFRENFAPTADQIYNITAALDNLSTKSLTYIQDHLGDFKDTLSGIFAFVDIIWMTGKAVIVPTLNIICKLLGLANTDVLTITGSIGRLITKFRDWLSSLKGLQWALNLTVQLKRIFYDIVGIIRKFIVDTFNKPVVQESLANINELLNKITDSTNGLFKKSWSAVKEFLASFKDIDKISFDKIGKSFDKFKEKIKNIFTTTSLGTNGMTYTLASFGSKMSKTLDTSGGKLSEFTDKISSFYNTIKEKFAGKIGIGEILTIGLGLGMIKFMGKLGNFLEFLSGGLKTIFDFTRALNGVLSGIKGVFDSVSESIKADAAKKKAEAFKTIAEAITILAGSIAVLSLLDQGKVWSSVAVIGVLAGVLIGLSKALSTPTLQGVGIKPALAILELASALTLVAIALNSISKLDPTSLAISLGAVTVIFGEFVGLMAATNLAKGDPTKAGLAMIAMAGALYIVSMALKKISRIKPENISAAIVAITIVFAEFVGLMAATKLVSDDPGKAGLAMIAMAGALYIIALAFNKITHIKPEGIVLAMTTITLVFAEFVGLLAATKLASGDPTKAGLALLAMGGALYVIALALNKIAKIKPEGLVLAISTITLIFAEFVGLLAATKLASGDPTKAGLALLAIGASLIFIAEALKIISKIDPKGLSQALIVMTLVFAEIVGLMAATKLAGNPVKIGGTLIAIAAALLILSASVALLSLLKPDGLARATAAVVVLEGMFAVLMLTAKSASSSKSTIIALAVAIGVMAVALGALSMIDQDKLRNVSGCLALVIGALALAVAATGIAKTAVVPVLLMTAVLIAIGGLLYHLSKMENPKACVPIAEGISLLLISLGAAMVLLSASSKIGQVGLTTVGMLALLALVASGLGLVLTLLVNKCQNGDAVIPIATAIGILLTALSANLLILSLVGKVASAALAGIGVLAVAIVGIGALMVAIGALVDANPKIEEFINKSIPILEAVGQGIGSFIGGIAEGIIDAVGHGLANLGTNLTTFMDNASGFFDRLNSIDADKVRAVGYIADMVLKLSEAAFINGINTILTFGKGSFSSLGEQLGEFADSLFGTDGNGGFISKINNISDNDVTKAQNVAKIISAFAESAAKVPNAGGLLAKLVGDNDLATFGTGISDFVDTLCGEKGFLPKIQDVTEDDVICAKNVSKIIESFVTVAEKIPNAGGLLAKLVGDNDLATFGKGILDFMNTLCGDQGSLAQIRAITEEDVSCAKNVGKIIETFATVAQKIPNAGGLLKLFIGDNDLKDFGEGISDFVGTMSGENGFLPKIREVTESDITSAGYVCDIISQFSDVATKVSDSKSFWDQFKNGSLAAFGSDLSSFGGYYKTYSESISGISFGRVATSIDQVNNLVAMCKGMDGIDTSKMSDFGKDLKSLGKSGLDKFIEAFENSDQRIRNAVSTMLNNFIDAANDKLYSIKTCFKNLTTGALDSLNDSLSKFSDSGSDAAKNFGTNAVSSIREYYNSFYYAGKYIVEGLAAGIDDYTYKATDAAKNMSRSVYDASRSYLDINSPSKLFRSMAGCIPEGMAQGIEHESWMVRDAATSMANDAVQGTSRAIAKIANLVSTDIDTQPTIRPVLDLSDVSKGANYLNGLFETNPSIGVMSNVHTISSMMNNRQNGSNDDVIAAIHDLGKQINKSSGDTYSINGITYTGDSDVSDAIRTLVRAVRIEGRT